MRHGTSHRRQRGRSNNGGSGHNNGGNNGGRRGNGNRMQVFDSNGPDVRIRGTAHQVAEKYLTLAKDAASSGDRILAESYLQHAEHYQRVINSFEPEFRNPQSAPSDQAAPAEATEVVRDDLSLPSSIIGAPVKAQAESIVTTRTEEFIG